MSKGVILVLCIVAVFTVAGCNTMAGIGKDIQKAGEAIQKTTK